MATTKVYKLPSGVYNPPDTNPIRGKQITVQTLSKAKSAQLYKKSKIPKSKLFSEDKANPDNSLQPSFLSSQSGRGRKRKIKLAKK